MVDVPAKFCVILEGTYAYPSCVSALESRVDRRANFHLFKKWDWMNSENLEGAIQSLVWANEEIAKTGNKKAEHHAQLALKYLVECKPKAERSPDS